jgi:predicted transcriptional regulator
MAERPSETEAEAAPSPDDLVRTEEPSFAHIMSCVFGIREHESEAYLTLLERPGRTTDELAEYLDRDRSNVSRSLQSLLDRNLATRERRLLDGGGFVYQYSAVDLGTVKDRLHESLERWTASVHDHIDAFGSERE